MNSYDKVLTICRELLLSCPEAELAKEYCNSRIPLWAQELYSFGWFPNKENTNILLELCDENTLLQAGAVYPPIIFGDKKYINTVFVDHNLVLGYKDVYGHTIGIVGRTLLNDKDRNGVAKYKNTKMDKSYNLFGFDNAKEYILKEDKVYVVEGQIDQIMSFDRGLKNVVCLGNSNMSFEQFALIMRYTKNIVMMLDNDTAGKDGSNKAIKQYGRLANIKNLDLPMGIKDVDELLKDCSLEDFKALEEKYEIYI